MKFFYTYEPNINTIEDIYEFVKLQIRLLESVEDKLEFDIATGFKVYILMHNVDYVNDTFEHGEIYRTYPKSMNLQFELSYDNWRVTDVDHVSQSYTNRSNPEPPTFDHSNQNNGKGSHAQISLTVTDTRYYMVWTVRQLGLDDLVNGNHT